MIKHTACPVVIDGEHRVEITTTQGKTKVIGCNWLVYKNGMMAYHQKKKFIQDAFPTLSADDREFLLSGLEKAEWEAIFGSEFVSASV